MQTRGFNPQISALSNDTEVAFAKGGNHKFEMQQAGTSTASPATPGPESPSNAKRPSNNRSNSRETVLGTDYMRSRDIIVRGDDYELEDDETVATPLSPPPRRNTDALIGGLPDGMSSRSSMATHHTDLTHHTMHSESERY
jgi:hypothetical protein